MLRITSVHNPRIKAAAQLRHRDHRQQRQQMLIDGRRELALALAAGIEVVELFYDPQLLASDPSHQALIEQARARGGTPIEVTALVLQKLAYGQRCEGMVAVARMPQRTLGDLALPADALVAVVEGIEKPGNLGAILRTADATGVHAVIAAGGGTDLYNPNVIRASLGAVFTVPTCHAATPQVQAYLAEHGFRILTAQVAGAAAYWSADFRGRVAIVLGSEAQGLSAAWQHAAHQAIRLPMHGHVDSLNVSVTAAVLLYEALRQRTGPAGVGESPASGVRRSSSGLA
jgi:TrmH family RNA methyltransferase